MEEGELLAGVNTLMTEELESEGLARDIVRRIQALRKEADFNIDDRIETYYAGDQDVEEVFRDEAEYISAETLTTKLQRGAPPEGAHLGEFDIDGKKLKLGLLRI
jgi:isoleucyl-tRNA synthetase